MTLSAIQSKPFKFAQWTDYIVPGPDEVTWKPAPFSAATRDRPANPAKVAEKFVYVYQRVGPGTSATPILEVFVENNGAMRVLSMFSEKFEPRPERRPATNALKQVKALSLEHTINGRDVFYYFFISRIRVHLDILQAPSRMETSTTDVLPEVDLKDLTQFVQIGGEDHIAGLDPVVIADELHKKYELARDNYLSWTIPSPDNPDKNCEDRLHKKLLADTIIALMDNNPTVKSKLEPQFIGGLRRGLSLGEAQMRDSSKDYDDIVKVRIQSYNEAGATLCHWLSGTMLQGSRGTVPNSFGSLLDPIESAEYLEIWHAITHRLQESDAGRVFLSEVLNDKTHWVHDFVLPQTNPTPKTLKGIAGKLGTVLGLWHTLATVGIKIPSWLPANKKASEALVTALQFITSKSVTVETIVTKTTVQAAHVPTFDVRVSAPQIRMLSDLDSLELRNKLAFALEVINFGLAIQAYVAANSGVDRRSAAAQGVKSMTKIVIVGITFRRLLTEPLKKAGAIAAVIDVVCSSDQAVTAWEKGKFTEAALLGLSVIGSLLVTWGAMAVLLGATSAPTLVGIPVATLGLILTTAGAVLLWVTASTDLEDFVAHCVWGKFAGLGQERRAWAGGRLADLNGNLIRQNEAFLNLLASFRVVPGRQGKQRFVRIFINRVDHLSVLRITFTALTVEFDSLANRKETTNTEQTFINCGDKTLSLPGSDVRTPFPFGKENGQDFVEVFSGTEVSSDGAVESSGIQFLGVSVSLDYFGDGSRLIPGAVDGVRPPAPPKAVGMLLFPRLEGEKDSRDIVVQ